MSDYDIDNFDDFKIILWIILFLLFGIVIVTCRHIPEDQIMTVNGPEPAGRMGVTLEHEHILVDFRGAASADRIIWNRDSVAARILPILNAAAERGVKTFIDCTPAYLGRDPLLLRELSREAGMIILTNTGYYGAVNNKYLPESFYGLSAAELAGIWIDESENGIEGTGIRPGFIKIGVNPADTLSPEHRKLITAAGIAHLSTGLVIASHTGPDGPAFEQIEILEKEGVDPSAFIWVHAQSGTAGGNIKAAEKGAWISLDNIHERPGTEEGERNSIGWYAGRIEALKEAGYLSRVLISHDSGWYDPEKPGGRNINGFTDIFDHFIPELEKRGFTDDEIDQLLVRNPREAFSVKVRSLKKPG